MKKFALIAVVALAVAAPAFAQTQLERSVGAAAGQYTLSQLVQLKVSRTNSGNEKLTYFQANPADVTSHGRHSATTVRIFSQLANENQGDRN